MQLKIENPTKISLLIKYIRYLVIFKSIKTLFRYLANQTKHKIIPIKDFESCQELNKTILFKYQGANIILKEPTKYDII